MRLIDGIEGDEGDDGSLQVSRHVIGGRTRRRRKPVVLGGAANWWRDDEADGVGAKAPWVPVRTVAASDGSTFGCTATFEARDKVEIVRLREGWRSPRFVRKSVSMAIWGVDWDGIKTLRGTLILSFIRIVE